MWQLCSVSQLSCNLRRIYLEISIDFLKLETFLDEAFTLLFIRNPALLRNEVD